MLKMCAYCKKVHDSKKNCPEKNEAIKKRNKKNKSKYDKFRWTNRWRKKAEEIKGRDLYLCQACIRNLDGTERKYNSNEPSVHHIIALHEDFDKRLENENLITLCRTHHEMAEDGRISKKVLLDMAAEQEAERGTGIDSITLVKEGIEKNK